MGKCYLLVDLLFALKNTLHFSSSSDMKIAIHDQEKKTKKDQELKDILIR